MDRVLLSLCVIDFVRALNDTAVADVRPRHAIQRLSASIVFLSTIFSGKIAPLMSFLQNKTNASAVVLCANPLTKVQITAQAATWDP